MRREAATAGFDMEIELASGKAAYQVFEPVEDEQKQAFTGAVTGQSRNLVHI